MLTISLKNIVKPADPKFLEPARIIPFLFCACFVAISCSIFAISLASMPYSPTITVIAGLFLCIALFAVSEWCYELFADLERWHHHLRKSKFRTINLF